MVQAMLKSLMCAAALTAALTGEVPALAQDARQVEKRVDKLESEMRAVQRKVFPGGDKRYFEPEFQPTDQTPAAPVGVPATSPIADLTTRVDGLERQLQSMTGQIEQASYKVRQMEAAMAKFRTDTEFRLTQLEGGTRPSPATLDEMALALPPLKPPAKPSTATAKPAAVGATPATADAATAKPADPIEAAYQAAYLSYSGQQYARAETALIDFVAKHPRSRRASHAQYWLGRTYMAQKQPAQAAKAFLDNYRNMPKGERAPDSLYWLGQSLMTMAPPQPAKACEVYDELASAYDDKLSTLLKGQVDKARVTAKCAA